MGSSTHADVNSQKATHLLGKVASAIGRVENLIVKHREVESQAQADRMSWRQLKECNILHTVAKMSVISIRQVKTRIKL